MKDAEFVARCEQAAELLTSLVNVDGVTIDGVDQTFRIDMHGNQVALFILMLRMAEKGTYLSLSPRPMTPAERAALDLLEER